MDLTPEKILALCGDALALGLLDKAEALARAYLETGEEDADLRGVVAAVHLERGNYAEAILDYSLAIKWGGQTSDRLFSLGLAYQRNGNLSKALDLWGQALDITPSHHDAAINAVLAALKLQQWRQAVYLCKRSLSAGEVEPKLYAWMGHAYAKLNETERSISAYRRAVDALPQDVEVRFLLALGVRDQGQFDDARELLHQVLELEPEHVEARFELAQLELMHENWREGFSLWESRLQRKLSLMPSDLPARQWNGEADANLKLLIQAEQGFGDTLQFARFVHLATTRVKEVVLRVHPQLVRLLQVACPKCHVQPFAQPVDADAYIPLLSLPRILEYDGTLLENSTYLAEVFPQHSAKRPVRTIGVVWSGSSAHHNDWRRSSSVEAFSKLRQVTDTQFVHFQMDVEGEEIACWPELECGVVKGADFLDTVRRLEDCDLVIGVDTALIHLSAALGHMTWVVVPYVPDWRWGEAKETTPWYDAVRVWRQLSPGDWNEVIERIARTLQSMETV